MSLFDNEVNSLAVNKSRISKCYGRLASDKLDAVLREYHEPEHYLNAIEAFNAYAGMTLFAFARHECSLRDIVIRNFIARSSTMLSGIGQLWQIDDCQDCWILHRCLMDRLFHLKQLADTNGFDSFEAWSFFQKANASNSLLSDTEFSKLEDLTSFRLTSEQKARYAKMSKSKPR